MESERWFPFGLRHISDVKADPPHNDIKMRAIGKMRNVFSTARSSVKRTMF
jgi:hypothetical protein